MSVAVTMTQPIHADSRFVEHTSAYQLEQIGPDPELKKILPLIFTATDEIEEDTDHEHHDEETLDVPFDDVLQTVIDNIGGSKKVTPIASEDLIGISSHFSRYHPGIDYRARVGSPVRATLAGAVNEIGYERGGYGRYVILVHHVEGETLFSLYAHLKKTTVAIGDEVNAGQTIGEVGLTGRTTGPHLHYELHNSRSAMDPSRFFGKGAIAMIVE